MSYCDYADFPIMSLIRLFNMFFYFRYKSNLYINDFMDLTRFKTLSISDYIEYLRVLCISDEKMYKFYKEYKKMFDFTFKI